MRSVRIDRETEVHSNARFDASEREGMRLKDLDFDQGVTHCYEFSSSREV